MIGDQCTAAGGIVGLNKQNCMVHVAYNIGNVTAKGERGGGIIGTNENSAALNYGYSIATVYAKGQVATGDVNTPSSACAGKIIGLNYLANYSNIRK